MAEKIKEQNTLVQYKSDMQVYGISVIYSRMCPDYRDGLKLVQRRLIYGMDAFTPAGVRKVKSAEVVGAVMGKLHPHGDSSIYDTMKPLVNWSEINIPLIEATGNFGSFLGDPAAASRYTESKLSNFALDVFLKELKMTSKTSDWTDTYDGSHKEPVFLPASLPMLLINGCFGIAVGLKVEIPRHNINEVIDATLKLIDNPNSNVVLVPDCCMECDIVDSNWKEISNRGHGKYKVRGKIDIGEWNGKPALFIRSLPDLVFLDTITEKIESLVAENKIIGIQECHNKSDTNNLNYIIVLKKGTDPNYVRQVIYSSTEMEKSFNVNMEVLDGLNLVRMSYKSYLESFIEFRKDTKLRLYSSIMQYNMTKIVEKDAFIKLFTSKEADALIEMIRKSKKTDDAELREILIKKLKITELQAKYILNAPFKALSQGYLDKYIADAQALNAEYQDCYNKVMHPEKILAEIRSELVELKKKYGKPRKCKIISETEASGIPQGEFKIVISNNNMIKKVGIDAPIGTFKNDSPKFIMNVSNTENILLFGADGRVYNLPIHKIPLSDRASNGTDIRILCKNLTADIIAIVYEPMVKDFANKVEKYYVTVITNHGMCKKIDIQDFLNVPPSGLIYHKLDPGDLMRMITIAGDGLDLIVYNKHKALRMSMKDIPYQKRSTKGLKAMNSEIIDGMSIIRPDSTDIVVITSSGKINRFDVAALPRHTRNKVGSKVINLGKNDYIVGVYGVTPKSIINLTTDSQKLSIPVESLDKLSSVSAGNKVLKASEIVLKVDIVHNK